MKNYIILYSIDNDEQIKERIRGFGTYMSYFPKSWVISTDIETAKEIYNKISLGYEKERILVLEINGKERWGVMPAEGWDWFKKNAPKDN